jgi:hypothetical protein
MLPTIHDSIDKNKFAAEWIAETFFTGSDMPIPDVLSGQEIYRTFWWHDALFGEKNGVVYDTCSTLGAFLTQVISDGKLHSCSAAVSRFAAHCMENRLKCPSVNTGNYCVARAKLDPAAIRELMQKVHANIEFEIPNGWLWKGRHVYLVDGFTSIMDATDENLECFPHPKTQKEGVGMPIIRACVITSLATGLVVDARYGPYQGKETGESALCRQMLDQFQPGDVVVFDRHYCSYWMLALLIQKGVEVCTRMHQKRKIGKCGRPISDDPNDMRTTWAKPQRPTWMSAEQYQSLPETISLRVVHRDSTVGDDDAPVMMIVTTLTDEKAFSKEEIDGLYTFRWCVETDVLDVKTFLGLNHMRCKTPPMIEREFYVTLLANNLVKQSICQARFLGEKEEQENVKARSGRESEKQNTPVDIRPPARRISVVAACSEILAMTAVSHKTNEIQWQILRRIGSHKIPFRPNRIEPRVLRVRKQTAKFMTKPRSELRAKLAANRRTTQ